jgi:hypothetical protein
MQCIRLLLLLLALINTFSFAQDDNTIFVSSETIKEVSLTYDEIMKLPVKKIRKLLNDRGLSCKGCSEKEEFVKMAYDNIDLPIKVKVAPPKTEDTQEDKDKNIDEVMHIYIYIYIYIYYKYDQLIISNSYMKAYG